MTTGGTEWRTPKAKNRSAIAVTPSPTAPTVPPKATEPPTEDSASQNRFAALSEEAPTQPAIQEIGIGTNSASKDTDKPTAPSAKDTVPPQKVPNTATVNTTGPKDYQVTKLQSYYPSLAPKQQEIVRDSLQLTTKPPETGDRANSSPINNSGCKPISETSNPAT